MALNIKNRDVEKLLDEVVQITGESKTEAVRKALEERRQRLSLRSLQHHEAHLLSFFQDEVWPRIPPEILDARLSKEEETILGYGEQGV